MIWLTIALAEIFIFFIYKVASNSTTTTLDWTFLDAFLNSNIQTTHDDFNERRRGVVTRIQNDVVFNATSMLERTSQAIGYEQFPSFHLPSFQQDKEEILSKHSWKEKYGRNYTLQKLKQMGITQDELVERRLMSEVPPWWQIFENYGERPVILGLERCSVYRDRVNSPQQRHLAPAGIFSSGTNILQKLLYDNCQPPHPLATMPLMGSKQTIISSTRRQALFNLWQVPWGKHNPASFRNSHIAKHQEYRNQSAVLPIVTIRHPYTWLRAICRNPYSLQWPHSSDDCETFLNLTSVVHSSFGNGFHQSYDSLIHVWHNWNLQYFQQNNYPLLMVRMEDLIFRPVEVIQQVCHCAGGTMAYEIEHDLYSTTTISNQSSNSSKKSTSSSFIYQIESANLGKGHGQHRSDLLSAFLRYGRPLQLIRQRWSLSDQRIIDQVLQTQLQQHRVGEENKSSRTLLEAFGYHL